MSKAEFLIKDRVVNVTKFQNHHPGGSVIKYYIESEATDAFNAFHTRSDRAHKILTALTSRKATPEDYGRFRIKGKEKLTEDFEEFRQQLKAEGFYDPDYYHIMYRIFEIAFMLFIGGYLCINYWETSRFTVALGIIVLGIGQGRCGWLMHEGGHHSLTGNITMDIFLQKVFYCYGNAMSARWWRVNHNKHHSTPQKLGHDPDLRTLPMVAFCKEVASQVENSSMKAWVSLQYYLFVPVTCFIVAFSWQIFLHPRMIIRKSEWLEAFLILSKYATISYLNYAYFGFTKGTILYAMTQWIGAIYIFLNFAVSHTHLPVVPKDKHLHWAEYSAYHTMNVTNRPWCNWWMSYLNFQIEHHLFPSMPQYRFPEISPRVKAFFHEHDLPYLYTEYLDAMKMTMRNLDSVAHAIG
jgi:fatty acid desaturase